MKKLLLSCICVSALIASDLNDIEKLKLENQELKQRIENLEKKFNTPIDLYFDNFDKIFEEHEQRANKLSKIIENEINLSQGKNTANSKQNFYTYFQSNNIVSFIKQKIIQRDKHEEKQTTTSTYNIKTQKQYSLKDIIKNLDEFSQFFNKNYKENISDFNFYINNFNFIFFKQDSDKKITIPFDEIKDFLNQDFLNELGNRE